MSKVINKFMNKAKGRTRTCGGRPQPRGSGTTGKTFDEQSSEASPHSNEYSESPRSVAGSSAEDLFHQHRTSSGGGSSGAYDQEPITTVPISSDGNIRRGSNPGKGVGFRGDFDITEEPSDGDYDDFGHDTNFCDFQQSGSSFHHSMSNSNSDYLNDFSNSSGNDFITSGKTKYQRSQSVQRPMQDNRITILEPELDSKKRRSKSTGRSERRDQITASTLRNYEANRVKADTSTSDEPKRKSKMEKIFQLQEKNQRYKDEFRKVQKDRKALKKEVENRKLETAALTKEIDTHIAEIFILKKKLSEALHQLDQTDLDERKDKSAITKLQKELSALRGDYNAAVGRVARMREEVEAMKVSINMKDDQIKTLNAELTEQSNLVDSLQMEIVALKKNEGYSAVNNMGMDDLKEENDRLQAELGHTLERASSMVKEREEAIADLLRENEEMKRLLSAREEGQDDDAIAQEEIAHLREELRLASAALEEAQDRNVLLEEDVEASIVKRESMEAEMQRFHDDVEAWQQKAAAAERSMSVVEASARESAKKVVLVETALAEAERLYKEQLQEKERRHTEALLDQKEKLKQQMAAANEAAVPPNPQELMLQKAVADRKAKEAAKGGSWGSVIQRVRTAASNGEAEEDLSPEQKRIKELEMVNADQEAEISKVKSEMVRLRSTYNDTMYTNKKRIEQLEQEKAEYAAKQQAMELEIASLRMSVASFPDMPSGSTVASF